MRYVLLALTMLLSSAPAAHAQVSAEMRLPGVDIGINLPAYPDLVRVPGYPVYYDPHANWNYFFYDGLYWVYRGDNWYASGWYNGPWRLVGPEAVPLYLLRVPVRYYRQPPVYFHGWRADAPPRWGEHWGRDWEAHRHGWDHWDRRSAPRPAPLPIYQRQYSGDRYPREAEQQRAIRSERYRYQPREAVARQHFGGPEVKERDRRTAPQDRSHMNRPAPPDRSHANKPAPPDKSQVNRPAQPDRSRASKTVPPSKSPVSKAAPPEKSRENKKEGHGPDRQ